VVGEERKNNLKIANVRRCYEIIRIRTRRIELKRIRDWEKNEKIILFLYNVQLIMLHVISIKIYIIFIFSPDLFTKNHFFL